MVNHRPRAVRESHPVHPDHIRDERGDVQVLFHVDDEVERLDVLPREPHDAAYARLYAVHPVDVGVVPVHASVPFCREGLYLRLRIHPAQLFQRGKGEDGLADAPELDDKDALRLPKCPWYLEQPEHVAERGPHGLIQELDGLDPHYMPPTSVASISIRTSIILRRQFSLKNFPWLAERPPHRLRP